VPLASCPCTEAEFREAIHFLADHGQPIDWLIYGDPFQLICKSAALSVIERSTSSSLATADSKLLALVEEYIFAHRV
jgi:hypothetical protein